MSDGNGAVEVVPEEALELENKITPVWEVIEDMARRLRPMESVPQVAAAIVHLLEASRLMRGDQGVS